MTGARKTHVVTILAIMAAIGIGLRSRQAPRRDPLTPQDAVYAMLDASRSGNVSAYLSAYTGPMQQVLRSSTGSDSDLSKYLTDSSAALKGVAVGEPQAVSDRESAVRVEYVYPDRNETQTMVLEKVGDNWKIARVDGAERIKTLVPYGTPVR